MAPEEQDDRVRGIAWATVTVRLPEALCHRFPAFSPDWRPWRGRRAYNIRMMDERIHHFRLPPEFALASLEERRSVLCGSGEAKRKVTENRTSTVASEGLAEDFVAFCQPPPLVLYPRSGNDHGAVDSLRNFALHLRDQKAPNNKAALDFMIYASHDKPGILDRVAMDVQTMLACRRWDVFTPDLAMRTYEIGLPPGVLTSKTGDAFVAVPVVSVTRRQVRRYFKRTVSISVALMPCRPEHPELRAAAPSMPLWKAVFASCDSPLGSADIRENCRFTLEGNLRSCLEGVPPVGEGASLSKGLSLSEWLIVLAQRVGVILGGTDSLDDWRELGRYAAEAVALGVQRGAVLLEPGANLPSDERFKEIVSRLGVCNGEVGTSLIKTPYGQTRPELIMHFPDCNCTLVIRPEESDRNFPTYCALRAFAPMLSMSIGVATVKAMTYFFHHEVERQKKHAHLSALMMEFVADLDEMYDLDIRASWYKCAYESMKDLSRADRDFEHVRWSVQALLDQMSARAEKSSSESISGLTFIIGFETIAVILLSAHRTFAAQMAAGWLLAAVGFVGGMGFLIRAWLRARSRP